MKQMAKVKVKLVKESNEIEADEVVQDFTPALLEPLSRMKKDIRSAAALMSDDEARYLVDSYYQMQQNRIRAAGQVRAMSGEPSMVLGWLLEQSEQLENTIKSALKKYVSSHAIGQWLIGNYGIGPVIAAGLLAHIDITRAPTVGHIWSYAGLDPTRVWDKGQKRPWNAELKRLCFLIGEAFVKVSGKEDAYYGQFYAKYKMQLIERNERGDFADTAKQHMTKVGKATEAYKYYSEGKLPPAHIHARAKRKTVKLFLSHLHQVWYEAHYRQPAPRPYVIEHMGHAHVLYPPDYTPISNNDE